MKSSGARCEVFILASLYYGRVRLSMLKSVYSMGSINAYMMGRIYYD